MPPRLPRKESGSASRTASQESKLPPEPCRASLPVRARRDPLPSLDALASTSESSQRAILSRWHSRRSRDGLEHLQYRAHPALKSLSARAACLRRLLSSGLIYPATNRASSRRCVARVHTSDAAHSPRIASTD